MQYGDVFVFFMSVCKVVSAEFGIFVCYKGGFRYSRGGKSCVLFMLLGISFYADRVVERICGKFMRAIGFYMIVRNYFPRNFFDTLLRLFSLRECRN